MITCVALIVLASIAAAMLDTGVFALELRQSLGAPLALCLVGRLAEATIAFACHAWPRVKLFGADRIIPI